jgi:ferredoxin-NADP reductase
VAEIVPETPRAASIVLELPGWPGHRAGQHVDVRLTAEDGYQAQRSYSIASAPGDGYVVLTVERVPDSEVSPYLVSELRSGDQLELRGPIGRYFVWDDCAREPVLLVAGGSGIVPFRSMLRHRQAGPCDVAVRLLYSARSLQDVIYREELMRFAAYDEVDIRFALTREWPEPWHGHRGRIDGRLLSEVSWPAGDRPRTFICGPAPFVETAASTLAAQGQPSDRIKTERFGQLDEVRMEPLDGNAIGGPLFELFGREMTAADGACGHCGSVFKLAELRVYARAPGTVGRCRSCGAVVLVLTSIRGQLRVTFRHFRLLDNPGADS